MVRPHLKKKECVCEHAGICGECLFSLIFCLCLFRLLIGICFTVNMAGGSGDIPSHVPLGYQQEYPTESFRNSANAPLRKLTVDLIKTYRKINEVSVSGLSVRGKISKLLSRMFKWCWCVVCRLDIEHKVFIILCSMYAYVIRIKSLHSPNQFHKVPNTYENCSSHL